MTCKPTFCAFLSSFFVVRSVDERLLSTAVGTSIIGTFAGTGVSGSSGDTGAATSATLNGPGGVAVDANGNIYIADTGNNKVRIVSKAGIISTFAGTGVSGSTGELIAATSATLNGTRSVAVDTAGNIYIADTGNNKIRIVSKAGIISTFAGNGFSGSTI